MNKTALILSVALTTFILLAVGGIAYMARAADAAQAAALNETAQMDAAPADAALINDASVQQALSEREAAYQQMIAEANARLAQAQEQELALQAQIAALQQGGQTAAVQTTILPEEAAAIASTFLGQTSVYSVEPVTVQGVTIYAVTFSSGDMVYVSLDGQVVGSVAATQISAQNPPAPIARGGHDDDHEEREEHEDHDD